MRSLKIYIAIICLACLLDGINTFGQVSYSPYAAVGIGLPRNRTAPANRMMGGTGIALRDPFNLNTVNPAALNAIRNVTFLANMGFSVERGSYGTSTDRATYTAGQLTSVDVWLRLSKKWSTSIGLNPFSIINYNLSAPVNILGFSETMHIRGSGSINQFYWGHAFQLTKNLSLGAMGTYTQGTLNRHEEIETSRFSGINYADSSHVSGIGVELGLQYEIFLPDNYSLSTGLTYRPFNAVGTRHRSTINRGLATMWRNTSDNQELGIPEKIGWGLAIKTPQWTLGSDLSQTLWEKVHLNEVNTRNTTRWSLGGTFSLKQKEEKFRSPIMLVAGTYIEQNYLVLTNNPFTDWGASFGLELPMASNRGALHIGYQFNQLGSEKQSMIGQQTHVFVFDLTYRDLWGIKRKFN